MLRNPQIIRIFAGRAAAMGEHESMILGGGGLNEILSWFKSSPDDGLFLILTKVLGLLSSNTSLNPMLLSGNSPFQLSPEKAEAFTHGLHSLLFTTQHIYLCTRGRVG